jgi:hypothetical protein
MQVIIFSNTNGGVSVCVPTGELPIEQVLAKDCPSGAIIVDDATLPQADNDFFDAWEMNTSINTNTEYFTPNDLNNSIIKINLDKAKAMTKTRLRAEREPLLQAQDVLFQRALESSADTTAIVAEKTRLRDITKLVDSVTTLEGLRAIKV